MAGKTAASGKASNAVLTDELLGKAMPHISRILGAIMSNRVPDSGSTDESLPPSWAPGTHNFIPIASMEEIMKEIIPASGLNWTSRKTGAAGLAVGSLIQRAGAAQFGAGATKKARARDRGFYVKRGAWRKLLLAG